MNYRQIIQNRLDADPKHRNLLFPRAYMLTDAEEIDLHRYPFYGNWDVYRFDNYQLLVHGPAKAFYSRHGDSYVVLIGHAYNPYSGEIDEKQIVQELADAYSDNITSFFDLLDQLTGVFVVLTICDRRILAVQDCGGQKMMYFGIVDGRVVITSSPQLADDVFKLTPDPAAERLLASKGYYRGSGFLPGNLSPFRELKRLGANTAVKYENGAFRVERFFPRANIHMLQNEKEKDETIAEMYRILSNNITLATQKWPRVALSLTGGVDSKTALACATSEYGKLYIYSFISKGSEALDASAAEEICKKLNLKHHLYNIPENSTEIPDYDFLQVLIEHNTSNICKIHPNEKRKFIFLERLNDFDVEIKSDISEIGRAYTTRKYMNVDMPRKLAPRHLTIGQGRYFMEPYCMHLADAAYETFMKETMLIDDIYGYTMHDLCYWEVRMSSWAATSFASQEFFHEITIPYNNRNLMKLFLQFPEEERRLDIPHKRLMHYGNEYLADLHISIKDSYFAKKRMYLETIYYYYATRLNTCRSKL